jgi:hypothetical protein
LGRRIQVRATIGGVPSGGIPRAEVREVGLEPNPDSDTGSGELSVVASARGLENFARRSIESRWDEVRFVDGNGVVEAAPVLLPLVAALNARATAEGQGYPTGQEVQSLHAPNLTDPF